MRFLFWLVVLPLAVAMAFFAANNHERTFVQFTPLPYEMQLPLYALILGAIVLGLVIGGLAAWIGQHRWHAQARTLHRRVKHLEGEIEGFRARTAPPGSAPPPGAAAVPAPGVAPQRPNAR
ncbi:MAG: LapA family protein [Alphaproteobacteria bacterium]|nr:LapA family protein [Alphaproteobacteria bacterium]